jgi:regulatory protein
MAKNTSTTERGSSPRGRPRTIESLRPDQRDPSLVEVVVSGGGAAKREVLGRILRSAADALRLREGASLSPKRVDAIRDAVLVAAARTHALRCLARSDATTASLRAKLVERCAIDEDAAAGVVDRLVADGWIDDARYARDRAAKLAEERGFAGEAITALLVGEGVPESVAARAAAAAAPPAADAARALALARSIAAPAAGSTKTARTARTRRAAKIARTLAAKGFDPDTISGVLERLGLADDRDD